MPLADRNDPFLSRYYAVEIDGISQAGFVSCTGLSVQTEVMEYKEGGLNDYTHKLPGRSSYPNITLKTGMSTSKDLWDWYLKTIQGRVERKNISIVLYTPDQKEIRRWNLRDAFPVKWQGPDFTADQVKVSIETLEITHHGFEVQ